jgi:mannose-6-phosphate isomerase
MDSLYPLTFRPLFKERVWGGRRLEALYGKALPPGVPIGESWEISDRVGDVSVVANGPLAGKDLHYLVQEFGPSLLGKVPSIKGRFPLLVKILDSCDRLSLQVHPPGGKAAVLGGEPKTEFWYVAEAEFGAELYVGLKKHCTRSKFIERIEGGTVEDCFHKVPVRSGDAMFLPSGRVHALGAGMVIFEIQQNSDTTYRVFDWNRSGLDGKPRDLHIKESLESIDFEDFEPTLVHAEPKASSIEMSSLVKHALFSVDLASLKRNETLPLLEDQMQILCIVSGELEAKGADISVTVGPGQFCLLPACLKGSVVRALKSATVLRVEAGPGAVS